MSSLRRSVFLSTLITPTVRHTFPPQLIHPSSRYICIRVYVHSCGAACHTDCFSLKDEMVLLQIVTFRKRFMGARVLDSKVSSGIKGRLTAGGEGDPCEQLRYKQVNDFLFPLRLFPHLTAWRTLWRDGLEQRPFAKQPCWPICCRHTAQIPKLLLTPLAKLLDFRALISVLNHISSEDVVNKQQQGPLNTHTQSRQRFDGINK